MLRGVEMRRKYYRITKTVATFNNISVRHIVYRMRQDPNSRNKYIDLDNSSEIQYITDQNGGRVYNMYTKSKEGLVLESTDNRINEKPITSYFTYNNISELLEILNICEKWLIDEEYRDLFKYTSEGYPMGLTEKSRDVSHTVYLSGSVNKFIIAIPTIVHDNGVTYTGVRLKNEIGIIGDLANSEFINMKICLESLAKNLYLSSLSLIISSCGEIL